MVDRSAVVPVGVILPILLLSASVNHTLPSGPAVMPKGNESFVGMAYSAIVSAGVAATVTTPEAPFNDPTEILITALPSA